ncbi:MAG TPA: glycosyltransferase [Burkholderiales bacterium]|nr:glycosyltransferase [Burkholderiales bacterium]
MKHEMELGGAMVRIPQSRRRDTEADGIAATFRQGRPLSNVGVVAIGRNEGERLKQCLRSVVGVVRQVVYVDSGSTDGSVEMARAMGVAVVELDMRIPFRAGRARNEGFRRCRELAPDLTYLQFVDGDCEVQTGWIEKGAAFLDAHPDVAVVCGRRRERYPEQSVYNMLMDIEWDSHPLGEARACGGDALMRVNAVAATNGYRTDLMAGEEPELCIRLRAAGWRVWFLQEPMTLHDSAMTRFGQWWKRQLRSGYGAAQNLDLQGARPEYHTLREWVSAWFWGAGIPLAVIGFFPWWGGWSLALLLLYPLQLVRLAVRGGRSFRENWWHAVFVVLGKFSNMSGQVKFLMHRYLGKESRLITYK